MEGARVTCNLVWRVWAGSYGLAEPFYLEVGGNCIIEMTGSRV